MNIIIRMPLTTKARILSVLSKAKLAISGTLKYFPGGVINQDSLD